MTPYFHHRFHLQRHLFQFQGQTPFIKLLSEVKKTAKNITYKKNKECRKDEEP